MRRLLPLGVTLFLGACVVARNDVSAENCGKMLASRSAYLGCLEEKGAASCDHLLRLYQADAQVFVASGCAHTQPGALSLMQSPTW